MEVRLPAATAWTPVVHDIAYNARGQREAVTSGNDAGAATLQSRYHYDPQSFRLLALQTERLADTKVLQDLRYVHDAGGNITFIESRTDDTVYYDNAEVTPHRSFTYDALDRLIAATGREHDSTYDPGLNFPGSRRQTGSGLGPVAHKADGAALRRYTQTYSYDAVGNFLELRHEQGGAGGATSVRTYAYEVEPDGTLFNNQLHSTTVGTTTYPLTYDLHGNMTTMSHLHAMAWDSLDRLQSVQTQLRTAPDPSDPPPSHPQHDWFYVYDGGGQRVRKVKAVLVEYDPTGAPGIVAAEGEARQEERLYIGPFEIWRSYDGAGDTEDELETLHVMDGERRISMVETVTWTDGEAVEYLEPKWRYQLDDHLGTSCGEVTEAGWVIGWEEYHPYGTTALWSFDGTREVSGKRYRYTGMERDEETGLGYHSARYYCQWLGRWSRPDPIGLRGGMNLFAYVEGSPVSAFDRSGTAGTDPVVHEVDQGDTLSRISENYYGDESHAMEIYNFNKGVIGDNPDLIRPGQSLLLPGIVSPDMVGPLLPGVRRLETWTPELLATRLDEIAPRVPADLRDQFERLVRGMRTGETEVLSGQEITLSIVPADGWITRDASVPDDVRSHPSDKRVSNNGLLARTNKQGQVLTRDGYQDVGLESSTFVLLISTNLTVDEAIGALFHEFGHLDRVLSRSAPPSGIDEETYARTKTAQLDSAVGLIRRDGGPDTSSQAEQEARDLGYGDKRVFLPITVGRAISPWRFIP